MIPPLCFLAVAPDGTTQEHNLPLEAAQLVAQGLRERGFRIVWYIAEPPKPSVGQRAGMPR